MQEMSDLLRAEESRRLRLLNVVTLLFVAIGTVFVYRYYRLGLPEISIATLASMLSGGLVLVWVRRGGSSLTGGMLIASALFLLIMYASFFLGGVQGPAFDWFYVVPILGALLVNARVGGFFTGLVLLAAGFLWLAPTYGIQVPNKMPFEFREEEIISNRLSAVLAIGVLLGALAAQQRHSRGILERVNNELNYEMNQRTEMQARVVRTERAASMGSLAAGMAHEINNPLTYVIGNLELVKAYLAKELKSSLPGVKIETEAMLSEALDGAYRVAGLVRDLKTFTHASDEEMNSVDLAEILDRAVKMVGHEVKHRAQLEIDCPEDIKVLGNSGRVLQVVINLLTNAAHSIEPGSVQNNWIRLSATLDDGRVLFKVVDTGSGIDPSRVERIFEPFFTTKAVGYGMGMGLSITRNILQSMGGAIDLEYSSPRGTAFVVAFPPSESLESEAPAKSASALSVSAPRPELKVLVIDDEKQVLSYLAMSLSHHEVEVEADGRNAIRVAAEGNFDVIICDLMMPQVTGMEIYAALKERDPSVANRMIFMTGGVFMQEAADFLGRFGGRWIEKPIDLAEMESRIWARVEAVQAQGSVT